MIDVIKSFIVGIATILFLPVIGFGVVLSLIVGLGDQMRGIPRDYQE